MAQPKIAYLLSMSMLPLMYASAADAQSMRTLLVTAAAAADADQSATADSGMEEIIVTARRKQESLQDVPISISALSTDDIERKGLVAAEDLRKVAPGLNVSGLSRDKANFYIRGQGPGNLTAGARNVPGVATYFAEVPSEIAGPGIFYDLSSVQVLKGPQGTLFGRNTTGGAVILEPQQPEWGKNGGYAQAQIGSYKLRQFNAMINIDAVPDKVAFRVATEIMRRNGFTKSIITGQDQDDRNYEAVRGLLRVKPTDTIENLTIVDYRNKHNNGSGQVVRALKPSSQLSTLGAAAPSILALAPFAGLTAAQASAIPIRLGATVSIGCLSNPTLAGCPAPLALPAPFTQFGGVAAAIATANATGGFYTIAPTSTFDQILATQAALGARYNQNPYLGYIKEYTIGLTNKTTWDATDEMTFKNIFSFRRTRGKEAFNYSGTPLPLLVQTGPLPGQPWVSGFELFTEELQLQGHIPDAHLEYIVGGYYERQKPGTIQGTTGISVGSPNLRQFSYDDNSKAVFGHVEWTPLDILTLSGGVRHTWDHRSVSLSVLKADLSCNQNNPATATLQCPLTNQRDFKALTYDATASLKPAEGMMFYVSFRHGYKSGGLNIPVAPAPAPLAPDAYASYLPEKLDDLEIGTKLDFNIGNPARIDFAAFTDSYTNQQVNVSVPFNNPDGTTSFTSVIQSAAKSKIKGFEGQVTLRPFRGLSLNGFGSYLSAHPTMAIANVLIVGRQLPNQPKWKYGLGAIYSTGFGGAGMLTASFDYSWQSSYHGSLLPDARRPEPQLRCRERSPHLGRCCEHAS